MSNMYSVNNNGAKVEPWGTPHEEYATEEEYCPILTNESSVRQKGPKPVKYSASNTNVVLQAR